MLLGIAGIEGIEIGALISLVEILGIFIFIGLSELKQRRVKKTQHEPKEHAAAYSSV